MAIFTFDDLYFIQINGLSMGGKCGPSVANIYIYIKEIMWVKYNKPTIYKRFNDDIFVVSNYDIINSDKLTIQIRRPLPLINQQYKL